MKNIEARQEKSPFVFPSIRAESGEIERVAQFYRPDDILSFKGEFLESAEKTVLTDLTDDVWEKLENTDSFDIAKDDWEAVAGHTDHYNQETGANRDWQDIRKKMEEHHELDAPIILKYGDTLHLVSGNTRLMVARASGLIPKVLIVEIKK